MAYRPINADQVSVGDELTVFYRYRGGECGQGGVVTENSTNGITLKAPGDRTFTWWWNEIVILMCDTPLPKAELPQLRPRHVPRARRHAHRRVIPQGMATLPASRRRTLAQLREQQ